MSAPLSLDVPAPLSKFDGAPIIDDANQVLLSDAEDARLLSRQQLRQLKQELKQLARQLKRFNWHERSARAEAIRTEIADIKLRLNQMSLEYEAKPDNALKVEARQLQQRRRELRSAYAAITPDADERRVYRRWRRLQARLDEHHAAVNYSREYAALTTDMAREVGYFADKLRMEWTRIGLCHRYTVYRRGRPINRVDQVSFERVIASPDELQFKVRVQKRNVFGVTKNFLPQGVSAPDLISDETLFNLSVACERPIYTPIDGNEAGPHQGLWVAVRRNGLSDGIIDFVTYETVMQRYSSVRRDRLPLPLGVKRGRIVNWVNLADHPHMLLSGKSGAGKSNVLNVIIATLISRHSPAEVQLALVDLKEGVELERYQHVPHVIGGKVIQDINGLLALLEGLEQLRAQRMGQIKALGSSIDVYNAYAPIEKKMPRIIAIVDEFAAIDLAKDSDPDARRRILNLTDQIAAKARAAGIHLLLGTQAGFADVLSKLTRANITVQVAGAAQTLGASMAATGSGEARKLPDIKGRMLMVVGSDMLPVQMPFISDEAIAAAIKEASAYERPAVALPDAVSEYVPLALPEVNVQTPEERVVETILKEMDGNMAARRVHDDFLRDLTQRQVERIVKDIEDAGGVEYNGVWYGVQRTGGRGRQLVAESSNPQIPQTDNEHLSEENDEELMGVA